MLCIEFSCDDPIQDFFLTLTLNLRDIISISSDSIWLAFLIYFSIVWRSKGKAILFVVMIILCWSKCYGTFDTNNFYFPFFYFSDFSFILFYFLLKDNKEGTWQGSHMTGHIMWRHKLRTWWKGLEDDIKVPGIHMVALSKKWGEHEVETWTLG